MAERAAKEGSLIAGGLPPLDAEGVLWVAALDRVPIEDRIEWVATMKARVEEINIMRESYTGDPPGAGWSPWRSPRGRRR